MPAATMYQPLVVRPARTARADRMTQAPVEHLLYPSTEMSVPHTRQAPFGPDSPPPISTRSPTLATTSALPESKTMLWPSAHAWKPPGHITCRTSPLPSSTNAIPHRSFDTKRPRMTAAAQAAGVSPGAGSDCVAIGIRGGTRSCSALHAVDVRTTASAARASMARTPRPHSLSFPCGARKVILLPPVRPLGVCLRPAAQGHQLLTGSGYGTRSTLAPSPLSTVSRPTSKPMRDHLDGGACCPWSQQKENWSAPTPWPCDWSAGSRDEHLIIGLMLAPSTNPALSL